MSVAVVLPSGRAPLECALEALYHAPMAKRPSILKWLTESHILLKIWAFVSAGVPFVLLLKSDNFGSSAPVVARVFMAALFAFVLYFLLLAYLRIIVAPFKGLYLGLRAGYRTAVVATRTADMDQARVEALADLDRLSLTPMPVIPWAELRWDETVAGWHRARRRVLVVPLALTAGVGLATLPLALAYQIVVTVLVGAFVFAATLTKFGKDPRLGKAMETGLGELLSDGDGSRPAPGGDESDENAWRWRAATPFGPLLFRWANHQLELQLQIPILTTEVSLVARGTLDEEAGDMDFGEARFDRATIVSSAGTDRLVRTQLNAPVRSVLMGVLGLGASVEIDHIGLTVDSRAVDAPVAIDEFLRLAGALRAQLLAHEARDEGDQVLHALTEAFGAEERSLLLADHGSVASRPWCQEALQRWVEGAEGHPRAEALAMLNAADRGRLLKAILTDPETTPTHRAQTLGEWLETDDSGAVDSLVDLLSSGEHALVATLLDSRVWGEGDDWRLRRVSFAARLMEGPDGARRWDALPGLVVAALILAETRTRVSAAGWTEALTQQREYVWTRVERGGVSPTGTHLEYLDLVSRAGRWSDALRDRLDEAKRAAEAAWEADSTRRAGQLSLTAADDDGGLSVVPLTDDGGAETP